jgi:hypothetical protein
MSETWKDRLLKAVDDDGRSDRAISLAAGFGPNFVSQMRGTKAAAPKKPNVEYVRRLASVLGKELPEILGPEDDTEARLRAALIAYGVHKDDLRQVLRAIKGFVEDAADGETQEQDRSQAQTEPSSRRRAKAPSQ